MNEHKPYVITIVGAESSGKTTLARQLAEHYGSPWVPEYAREYLEVLGRPYDEHDLEIIAARQLDQILTFVSRESSVGKGKSSVSSRESAVRAKRDPAKFLNLQRDGNRKSGVGNRQSAVGNANPLDFIINQESLLIVDGGMLTLRMWARIKYGKTIPLVEDALQEDVTSLYLLCRPVVEWEPDPLREAPLLLDRVWIYNLYLRELLESKRAVEIIRAREK